MAIKCFDGGTSVSGTPLDTVQDFVNIIVAVRRAFADMSSNEDADVLISLCGKLAYAVSEHDEPREMEISKEIAEVFLKIATKTTT